MTSIYKKIRKGKHTLILIKPTYLGGFPKYKKMSPVEYYLEEHRKIKGERLFSGVLFYFKCLYCNKVVMKIARNGKFKDMPVEDKIDILTKKTK